MVDVDLALCAERQLAAPQMFDHAPRGKATRAIGLEHMKWRLYIPQERIGVRQLLASALRRQVDFLDHAPQETGRNTIVLKGRYVAQRGIHISTIRAGKH